MIHADDLPQAPYQTSSGQTVISKGPTMYELLGALAFAVLVVGYVLAIVFIRHEDDGLSDRTDGNRPK